MKHVLSLLLAFCLLLPTVQVESEPLMRVELEAEMYSLPPEEVSDAAFTQWVQDLLSVEAPCSQPEIGNTDKQYRVTFLDRGETYTVWHDDLADVATVTRPDGTVHSLSPDVPAMLFHLMWGTPSFSIPDDHRALLASYGWTIAFRESNYMDSLPKELLASRTDTNALYYTYADLFLRDSGYDITPYLGKRVVPYAYTVLEQKNSAAWYPEDAEMMEKYGWYNGVLYSLRAVVLECNGTIIGAYLAAYSNGADLMTLDGKTAVDLLPGSSIREYLLSKLPITDTERALAALSPEEVITRYAQWNDPCLQPIDVLLEKLGTTHGAIYELHAPLGIPYTMAQVTSVRPRKQDNVYEIKMDDGKIYFPQLVYESPETGWKVESFYNTGP